RWSRVRRCAPKGCWWWQGGWARPGARPGRWMPGCGRATTPDRYDGPSLFAGAPMLSRIPQVTRALLIANVVMFVIQLAVGDGLTDALALWPLDSQPHNPFETTGTFMPWQLLTYGFLHGDFMHLFFNMLALFMFGPPLE